LRERAAAVSIGLLTACSTATTPQCDGVSQDDTGSSRYSLDSGDRLQVVVYRLPLLGEIAARNLTTRQLEDEIESRLKADGFLISPQVGLQLVSHRSFYVVGEVGTPGSYEYRNGLTVITAIALAGGYTTRANRSSMTIGRGDCRFETRADTSVNPGDIITVSERFF
jgi:protein involved in polysaccharide export with SLBB domain